MHWQIRRLLALEDAIDIAGGTDWDVSAKWLELLKQTAPGVTRVAVLRVNMRNEVKPVALPPGRAMLSTPLPRLSREEPLHVASCGLQPPDAARRMGKVVSNFLSISAQLFKKVSHSSGVTAIKR